ncbi:MAG: tetratricopeptide repeat protein [Planctomycetes bacterium]|nr:tetratricopeptide repeat protein [Planctomycetota bacterium]MBI3844357.1 tetratricopeptide repeat protein [Planctomycetota bacterium]
MSSPSRARLIGPALFALGAAVYLVSLGNDWVLDDRRMIFDNPAIRGGDWSALFGRDYWWFQPGSGALYRPVTVASIALQHAIAGDAPWSYRLVNALLHGLVAWLLYSLLSGRMGVSRRAAGLAAALYAVHPALSEAVLQVVGRAEIFVALSTLAILHVHLAGYRVGRFGPRTLVPAALALLLVALGSKESAVAIPPLLLAVDLSRRRFDRRGAIHVATFGVMFAFWFGVRAAIVEDVAQVAPAIENPLHALTFSERLPGVLGLLGRYAKLALCQGHFSADYSFDAIPARPPFGDTFVVLGSILVILLGVGFAWACARRRVATATGIAIFALFLFPVSNLAVPIGSIFAERFVYVPLMGVVLLVALVIDRVPFLGAVVAVWIAVGGFATFVRESDWRDETTFYSRTANESKSAKAHWHYGLVHQRSGEFTAAEHEYRRALEIYPDYDLARAHLARALRSQGRRDEAIALYRQVIDKRLPVPDPYVDLGEMLEDENRFDEALALFRRAREIDPRYANAWFGEGKASLSRQPSDVAHAKECFEHAIRLDPNLAPAWAGLGDCLASADREAARRAYTKAVELAPSEPAYRARLDALR